VSANFGLTLGQFNVKSYGAKVDGSTDDTSAVQAAITACANAGGGEVYFPPGICVIGGAMQNTSHENAQLILPEIDISSAGLPISITLRGASPPNPAWWGNHGYNLGTGGSILRSTYTGGNGTQAMLAGYSAFTYANATGVHLAVRDLEFRVPVNPTLSALNLSGVMGCDLDRVFCQSANASGASGWTQPSTSGATGIITPAINNGAVVRLGQVTTAGFYYGYQVSEHCLGVNVQAFGCQYAMALNNSYHSVHFDRFGSYFGANGITVLASAEPVRLTIDNYNIEQGTDASTAGASPTHWPSRQGPTGYDFIDASNKAFGKLNYNVVLSGTGVSQSNWRASGGSNMTFTSLG
jgi:hypothetical protein